MTLYLLKLLAPQVQVRYVLMRGTYLAQRQDEQGPLILYYIPTEGKGFFVELRVDTDQTYFFVRRSFVSSVLLEDYSH